MKLFMRLFGRTASIRISSHTLNVHGRKRHCISNEGPKQRQSSAPWCLRGVTGPSQRHPPPPPRARYKTGGPAASDMDRSMLRQAGRHEKDTAKSETERLHCHLDVNSRSSSRHCRGGYGGHSSLRSEQQWPMMLIAGRKGTHYTMSAYGNSMPQRWRGW
jgi:hypothetical protein